MSMCVQMSMGECKRARVWGDHQCASECVSGRVSMCMQVSVDECQSV